MTEPEALRLIDTLLLPAYDWPMPEDQKAAWAEDLVPHSVPRGKAALLHLRRSYTGSAKYPKLGDLGSSIRATETAEYDAAGRRAGAVPWRQTDAGREAVLRQEWLIVLPESDYEAYCNARRNGDWNSAERAYRHGRRELVEAAAALWHGALERGCATQSEHDAVCDRLADPVLWPQEWRMHDTMARQALKRRDAA